jgi:hypothetical protein
LVISVDEEEKAKKEEKADEEGKEIMEEEK